MKSQKQIEVGGKVDDLLYKLVEMFPDGCTGHSGRLRQKLQIIKGDEAIDGLIKEKKLKMMRTYLLAFIALVLGLLFHLTTFFTTYDLDVFERPMWGSAANTTKAKAYVSYDHQQVSSEVTLRTLPATLSKQEKRQRLETVKAGLHHLILGENNDLDHVGQRLKLTPEDKETGVKIVWASDRPDVVDGAGNINFIRGSSGEQIILYAGLSLEDESETVVIPIRLDKIAKGMHQESLRSMLRESVQEINKNTMGKTLVLPADLGDGVSIQWKSVAPGNLALLMITGISGFLLIYQRRYAEVDRELQRLRDSILTDLPELMNKLVLLLNAGLVVSQVMEKIAEDHEQYRYGEVTKGKEGKGHDLYRELGRIKERSQRTNTSMIKEFQLFAQRSGVRELIRLSAMIVDNMNKGSALAEKLESESALLWMNRKKQVEEKGKTVETKLIFPLAILLMVLILITVAPALAEM